MRAKRTLTLTLEEDIARWVWAEAARQDTSVSRLVGEVLEDCMHGEEDYEAARDRFFTVHPRRLKNPEEAYPRRQDLY